MNMERVRQENRSLILHYINNRGAASRKEIASFTGLTQASVTQITTALIAERILVEAGKSEEKHTSPGRREVLLRIDAGNFLTFAVNAEPDITTAVICDLTGNVICGTDGEPLLRQFFTAESRNPQPFTDRICGIFTELKSLVPADRARRIECISFAITGIVDRERCISRRAYGIWAEEVDIRKRIGVRIGLPVLLENNVDAFAIAELIYGTGRKHGELLVIKWGPGVGSSVIIDGQVYRGRHEKTAELGHMIVDPAGERCICGRRGCLETTVSAKALQNAGSDEIRHKAVYRFARCIVNAGTIIAPSRIVLYGSLADDKQLRDELIRDCAAFDPSFGENRILHSSLSDKSCYIGPAALYTMHKITS